MITILHISLSQAETRGKIHNSDSIGSATGAQLLAMLALDIASDLYPGDDMRLIGTPAQALAVANFEIEIR